MRELGHSISPTLERSSYARRRAFRMGAREAHQVERIVGELGAQHLGAQHLAHAVVRALVQDQARAPLRTMV